MTQELCLAYSAGLYVPSDVLVTLAWLVCRVENALDSQYPLVVSGRHLRQL